MKVIGITGGIGAGKSYISNFFLQLNIPIYDSDSRAYFLMTNNNVIIKKIIELFGQQSYINGQLNKSYISSLIFQNKHNLRLMNSVIHPAVFNDFNDWLSNQTSKYVIYESALIYENKSQDRFDRVISVLCSDENRIIRLKKRGLSLKKIKEIMNVQLSTSKIISLSDIIIENNSNTNLKNEILRLHKIFSS
jgi:dephospho-CoA kinase|tara:strand:+ start:88 stop:663 length:576 start_codon:yes stop_codon:yes gene_type:complete